MKSSQLIKFLKYSVGDEVKIKIIAGDLERKTLDYAFAQ